MRARSIFAVAKRSRCVLFGISLPENYCCAVLTDVKRNSCVRPLKS